MKVNHHIPSKSTLKFLKFILGGIIFYIVGLIVFSRLFLAIL
ncbi:hypothetical protein KPC_0811 [Acinetobacter stercoris]|uniref:Uncharacterized protein n=1 Tax=Acinetobacter stercoris TaxID=2126983 RepID=A0A2U3MW98_9GAMM|nr:hypothetical protein KPC_0811 [Acinetobacter stercoris]